MAAIRELKVNEPNRFELVVIPKKEKGDGLDEDKALTLARMNCLGIDWEGGMKLSAFWTDTRGSMELNVMEFPDEEMILAGFPDAKQNLAVRESVWSKDGDKAWQGVKQEKCKVNLAPGKYRVKEKDKEGWWVANSKGQPTPFTEVNYAMFMDALKNQSGNPDLRTDQKSGAALYIGPFKANHAKMHDYVGKHLRWELRESSNG